MTYQGRPITGRDMRERERIVSPHGGCRMPSGNPQVYQSNGTTQTSATFRHSLVLNADYRDIRPILVNGYFDTSGIMVPNGNAIALHMGLEITGNLLPLAVGSDLGTPISTGGKTKKIIGDGEMVFGQRIHSSALSKGSTITYRTFVSVGAGEKWPHILDKAHANTGFVATTDAVYGTTVTDKSDQTAAFGNNAWGNYQSSAAFAFGPIAWIGRQVTPAYVVGVAGDSISAGVGSVANLGKGYIGKALENAGIAYHNDGISGATLANIVKYAMAPQELLRYTDHNIIHALTNDFQTVGISFETAKATLVSALRSLVNPGQKISIATVLPRGTNASAIDYASQSPASWEATRVQLNNWLRDPSESGGLAYLRANAPSDVIIAGIIDACPAIERNSDGSALVLDANGQQTSGTGGYWLMGRTGDFTHPNDTGVGEMAAQIAPAIAAQCKF